MIFSACGFNLFSMILHDFAWVADEADRWVVLALLQVAFLGKCDVWGLGPWDWPFSCLPNLVADCCESSDYVLFTCLDQFCWDVVNSTWLPFLQWLYYSLHFFVKNGVVILSVCVGTVQYWWISTGLVIVELSTGIMRLAFQSPSPSLSFFCEAFSRMILDRSIFPLFHRGQVFHGLICPPTVVLSQIFFNLITLFSYPVFLCLFHAPLDVVVSLPFISQIFQVWIFSSPVLSFCCTDQEFLQWPWVFSPDNVCQWSL